MLMESTPSMTNWQPVAKLKRPGLHVTSSLLAVAGLPKAMSPADTGAAGTASDNAMMTTASADPIRVATTRRIDTILHAAWHGGDEVLVGGDRGDAAGDEGFQVIEGAVDQGRVEAGGQGVGVAGHEALAHEDSEENEPAPLFPLD